MKRLQKYKMPMIPDYLSYLFDIYFCLGCYYCVSGELMRSERQKTSVQENIVFAPLFSLKIGSVSTKLANVLCAVFPKVLVDRCPPHIVKLLKVKFTGESLHQASISRAVFRGRLSILQLCARSGHMCNNFTDNYLDLNNVLHGLEGKNDAVCCIESFCVGCCIVLLCTLWHII